MLQITIPPIETWDEQKEEFNYAKEQTISLEHSLVSVAKWESKFHKSFFKKEPKSNIEILYYIKCMTITQNVSNDTYSRLTKQNIDDIKKYIDDPMTATTFNDTNLNSSFNRETVTSELIYYWMIALNIPMECQKWPMNRLMTLIRICNIKNTPSKKVNKRELASRYASLNEMRKKQLNTNG